MSYALDLHKIPRSLSEQSSLFSDKRPLGAVCTFCLNLSSFFLTLHCLASKNALSRVSAWSALLSVRREAAHWKHLFLLLVG